MKTKKHNLNYYTLYHEEMLEGDFDKFLKLKDLENKKYVANIVLQALYTDEDIKLDNRCVNQIERFLKIKNKGFLAAFFIKWSKVSNNDNKKAYFPQKAEEYGGSKHTETSKEFEFNS